MLVRKEDVERVAKLLSHSPKLALDCETSGLRPFHGDRLLGIAICGGDDAFYWNLQHYPAFDDSVLCVSDIHEYLGPLFRDGTKTWYLHNATFDMDFLRQIGVELSGTVHDTMVGARLEYNDHIKYDLASCAARIGLEKSSAIDEYCDTRGMYEMIQLPGKKVKKKNRFFDKVPLEVLEPYASTDALITYKLGEYQEQALRNMDKELKPGAKGVCSILDTERRLTKVVWGIKHRGLKIDLGFCQAAKEYEEGRAREAAASFAKEAHEPFKDSSKVFERIFESDRSRWGKSEKGNLSFDADALATFKNPLAKLVLTYRDAKSKSDFYNGFIYYTDQNGFLHPNLGQADTVTGRLGSREPNTQNLTNEEDVDLSQPFLVRRAIVPPSPEYLIASIDYSQQEYRMMLDYAEEFALIAQIKGGLDVHEATAQMMGVPRKVAKTLNFMLLYGGGAKKLGASLGVSMTDARTLKAKYFAALPGVRKLMSTVSRVAKERGHIRTWAGRRSHFKDPKYAYKAPNSLIQGGGADVMKQAMVYIHQFLEGHKTHMVLSVHDELIFYVHRTELHLIKEIQKIMENVYPAKHLPLECSVAWSDRSLADLKEGLPDESEARNKVQAGDSSPLFEEATKCMVFRGESAVYSGHPGYFDESKGAFHCPGVEIGNGTLK